jgi:F-type H+-transporting ATPase subunit a
MNFNPDNIIVWHWGIFPVNATLLYTWLVMIIIILAAWLATRNITSGIKASRWQIFMEIIVESIRKHIQDISHEDPEPFQAFIGSFFLFIAISNLLTIVPGFRPPTGSLSTTTALALCVFLAVPVYGIKRHGLPAYFKQYTRPSVFMLPFNIIGEISRTIALAVRLFGNMMSGTVVVAVLISITPFLFPIILQLLGLLTGMIQAYIFSILAMVYISSALITTSNKTNRNKGVNSTH